MTSRRVTPYAAAHRLGAAGHAAVAATLSQARSLDRQATLDAFEEQLQRPSRERLGIILDIAREAFEERRGGTTTRGETP